MQNVSDQKVGYDLYKKVRFSFVVLRLLPAWTSQYWKWITNRLTSKVPINELKTRRSCYITLQFPNSCLTGGRLNPILQEGCTGFVNRKSYITAINHIAWVGYKGT